MRDPEIGQLLEPLVREYASESELGENNVAPAVPVDESPILADYGLQGVSAGSPAVGSVTSGYIGTDSTPPAAPSSTPNNDTLLVAYSTSQSSRHDWSGGLETTGYTSTTASQTGSAWEDWLGINAGIAGVGKFISSTSAFVEKNEGDFNTWAARRVNAAIDSFKSSWYGRAVDGIVANDTLRPTWVVKIDDLLLKEKELKKLESEIAKTEEDIALKQKELTKVESQIAKLEDEHSRLAKQHPEEDWQRIARLDARIGKIAAHSAKYAYYEVSGVKDFLKTIRSLVNGYVNDISENAWISGAAQWGNRLGILYFETTLKETPDVIILHELTHALDQKNGWNLSWYTTGLGTALTKAEELGYAAQHFFGALQRLEFFQDDLEVGVYTNAAQIDEAWAECWQFMTRFSETVVEVQGEKKGPVTNEMFEELAKKTGLRLSYSKLLPLYQKLVDDYLKKHNESPHKLKDPPNIPPAFR